VPAHRKYDKETRDRAVRMFQDRLRDSPDESARQIRRRIGELLGIHPDTMRGWIEQAKINAGQRRGVTTDATAELQALRRENRRKMTLQARVGRTDGARVERSQEHLEELGADPTAETLRLEHELRSSPVF